MTPEVVEVSVVEVVEVEITGEVVEIHDDAVEVVEVAEQGPPGPAGPQGDPGPPGPSGAGYTHTQANPAYSWIVNHNLGYRPAVDLTDSGGLGIDAEVIHMSTNQVVVNFLTPTAGVARLN